MRLPLSASPQDSPALGGRAGSPGGEAADRQSVRSRALAAGAPSLSAAQERAYPNYPVQYSQMRGSIAMQRASTFEALFSGSEWAWERDSRVVIEQFAADGKPVLTPGWPGGTWTGECGSTLWVRMIGEGVDPDLQDLVTVLAGLRALGSGPRYVQGDVLGETSRTTQAWFLNGRAVAKGFDGFRVCCEQKYRHEGLCHAKSVEGGAVWAWDQQAQMPTLSTVTPAAVGSDT